MRFIIYGAGGIGGVVGGHLARTGHDVIMVGRQGHVDAINQHGLRLVTPGTTYDVKLTAVTGLDKIKFTPDDVVFTTMKGQSTEEAIKSLKTQVSDIPVFCFQNGMRNEGTVIRYLPRVYGVMVRIGAVYLTDGEVTARRDPPGWLVIGRYPNGTDELAETVAVNLRAAGFLVKVSPDVMPYKWGKLMLNLANAVDAITNAEGKENQPIIKAAQDEAKDILKQAAIHWISADQLATEWPEVAAKPRGVLNTEEHSSTGRVWRGKRAT